MIQLHLIMLQYLHQNYLIIYSDLQNYNIMAIGMFRLLFNLYFVQKQKSG